MLIGYGFAVGFSVVDGRFGMPPDGALLSVPGLKLGMDECVEQSPIYLHLVPPPRRPPLFRLQTPVDGEDGAQHVKRPTGQRHLVHLKAQQFVVNAHTRRTKD